MTLISSSFCAAVDEASRPPLREGDPVRLGAAASGDGMERETEGTESPPESGKATQGPDRRLRLGQHTLQIPGPLQGPAAREKESIPPSPHDPPSGEGLRDFGKEKDSGRSWTVVAFAHPGKSRSVLYRQGLCDYELLAAICDGIAKGANLFSIRGFEPRRTK